MIKHTHHATHPDIVKRLKRANGHLLSVIEMIGAERPCSDIAQQLHAVEKAITQAKRTIAARAASSVSPSYQNSAMQRRAAITSEPKTLNNCLGFARSLWQHQTRCFAAVPKRSDC
jgi:hypothetical protein NreA